MRYGREAGETLKLLNSSGIHPAHVQLVLRHLQAADALRDIETWAEYRTAKAALDRLKESTSPDDHESEDAILRNVLASKVIGFETFYADAEREEA